jgi:hypothetical protein
MKKIVVTIGLVASLLVGAYGQTKRPNPVPPTKPESEQSNYEKRQLKVEEVNLVSSYYQQDGNNSAVTGGIGTEKLTDIANSIDIKLSKYDRKNRFHSINLDFNIDYYTSASSDQIDPLTISSPSKSDVHIYPSISWSMKDTKTRTTKGLSYAYSTEYDYWSHGFTLNYAKASADNNREVSLKASAFFDTWAAILPAELRPANYGSGSHEDRVRVDYKPRHSYNVALGLSQIVNRQLQVSVVVEPSFQQGLLSTPYHRVYFSNGSVGVERLPGSRLKLPVGFRANYFLSDQVIVRSFYRFYLDDWGMKAHTFNLEVPYKITSFFSVSPFYRFHTQTAVRYFNTYKQASISSLYHTSDYDIGNISSHFVGTGIRLATPGGILGIKQWNSLELRYGHYMRSNGMVSNIVTMHLKMK